MVCIGLLGCNHIHRSASSYYFLLGLMIAVTLLGLRILLYIAATCLQWCRQSLTADDVEEIEMQVRSIHAMQQFYQQQQQRRRSTSVAGRPSLPLPLPLPLPQEEWQSKLVIPAGCDHVSFIAQPCPLQTNNALN
ncbi:hypothetical protein Cni_G19803 [Canna indica]|uniref:Uncharacterized protein n=1 Tax=Canna indica TaxID=4628 RepID=A0AAQ3KSB8_9LILI|nr:hypothetical protein Cni_G19803 [Canna indica]